jgi:GAF domain-containing protein
MSVIVGVVATQADRCAAGSEQARDILAGEQAALRRVATLVARQPSPAEVFAAVTEEAARLLHLDSAHLIVYERDQTATVVGSCNLRGQPMPVGTRVPVEGDNIIGRVFRTQQPARIDDYSDATGLVAENVRSIGVPAAVGVPVLAGERLWEVMAVGSSRPEPLPADTEMRIGAFTELVGTAIANTAARGAGAGCRRAGGARRRRDAAGRSRSAGRGLHRGRRRGRWAVRGSACRALPLRAGKAWPR